MIESSHCSAFDNRLDIATVLRTPPPVLDFVLPGLVAGTAGLLVGAGGVGKTMLELQLAVLLATGLGQYDPLLGEGYMKDFPVQPQKVVLIAAEESKEVLWHRLHAVVQSLDQRDVLPEDISWAEFLERVSTHLHVFALGGRRRLNLLTEGLNPSRDAADLVEVSQGARLVIVDPMRQVHLEDENRSEVASALMSVFKSAAAQSGAAFLVAHHISRAAALNGYSHTADAGRGATAFKDDARWQVNLIPASTDLLRAHGIPSSQAHLYAELADGKGNYAQKRPPVLLRRNAGGVLVPVSTPEKVFSLAAARTRRSTEEVA